MCVRGKMGLCWGFFFLFLWGVGVGVDGVGTVVGIVSGYGGFFWKPSKQCLFAFKEGSTCVNVLFVLWSIV